MACPAPRAWHACDKHGRDRPAPQYPSFTLKPPCKCALPSLLHALINRVALQRTATHLQGAAKVGHQHVLPRRLQPLGEGCHEGGVQRHEGAQALAGQGQVLGSDALQARHLRQEREGRVGWVGGGGLTRGRDDRAGLTDSTLVLRRGSEWRQQERQDHKTSHHDC